MNEVETFEELKRTSDIVLELAHKNMVERGNFIGASVFAGMLDWKAVSRKIVNTPSWRIFKLRRLFHELEEIEEDLALLIHVMS